jgi:hypothetical protein
MPWMSSRHIQSPDGLGPRIGLPIVTVTKRSGLPATDSCLDANGSETSSPSVKPERAMSIAADHG